MRSVPRAVGVLALLLCVHATPIEAAKQRDVAVMPKVAPGSVASGGAYWARLIGIDQYQQRNVPKLQSAVKGAQAVREVLVQRYGLNRDKIIESINGQATRTNIQDALYQPRKQAGTDDSVFIYYAGHDLIETEEKQIELANVQDMAKQLDREITGNDGAPMVLVPEGEFLYGNDNQRLYLLDFYMDKYEVTTAQYAKFIMTATGTTAPQNWQTSVSFNEGQKPVVGIDWDEANAYCRYYGQRLPTEQEWEKAARGTDGRKYPWGDDEPTRRHANFNNCCDFWNYDVLFNVGSFEDGKSPYGIYDLAGNVYEWTSSDHHGRTKVIRGGAWMNRANSLDSSARGWHSPWDLSDHDGFRCVQDAR